MENWEEIYNKELFSALNCWKECDGYCCKNFFGKYFKFLDKETVILPLMEEEYEVYKKRGGIKNLEESTKTIFIKDKSITLYFLKCKEKGLCNPHSNRPFICRVYPYFPVVNVNGKIEDFVYASLMDNLTTYEYHKCPLIKKENIKAEIKNNIGTIKNPKIIFMFMLVSLLIKYLKKYIQNEINNENEEKKIIAKFEKIILSNKIFKDKDFQKEVEYIYDSLFDIYGDFL